MKTKKNNTMILKVWLLNIIYAIGTIFGARRRVGAKVEGGTTKSTSEVRTKPNYQDAFIREFNVQTGRIEDRMINETRALFYNRQS